MRITAEHLALAVPSRQQGEAAQPATILTRQNREVWLVRETPLETDLAPPWSVACEGAYVRIPLHPYRVEGTEPATAIALGVKLGARFLIEALTGALDPGARPARLHLVVGHPIEDWGDYLRFWLGLALLVERD